MIASSITSVCRFDENKKRYMQGDILKLEEDGIEVWGIVYNAPYLIILSQDCDLQQDFTAREVWKEDKYIDHVLVAPAFLYKQLIQGTHREGMGMQQIGSSTKQSDILKNNDKRYHTVQTKEGESNDIGRLTIDFKLFFTIPRNLLYEKFFDKYYCSLNELYREDLSLRFANFISRIGLPE